MNLVCYSKSMEKEDPPSSKMNQKYVQRFSVVGDRCYFWMHGVGLSRRLDSRTVAVSGLVHFMCCDSEQEGVPFFILVPWCLSSASSCFPRTCPVPHLTAVLSFLLGLFFFFWSCRDLPHTPHYTPNKFVKKESYHDSHSSKLFEIKQRSLRQLHHMTKKQYDVLLLIFAIPNIRFMMTRLINYTYIFTLSLEYQFIQRDGWKCYPDMIIQ